MESREILEEDEDRRFMEIALQEARLSAELGEVPVGAVVARQGQVLGRGGHRRESTKDPTAHAEMLAIRAAAWATGSWRLDGSTLYVTLEPCAMCAGAIILARVPRCVFGARDPKGGYCGTVGDLSRVAALNHRFEVVSGCCQDEAARLLSSFFQALRSGNSRS
jgi:tRNA(adenine34) deaminase